MLDAAALPNGERLAQLYDPFYVHRVAQLGDGAPVQVCIDSRMLHADQATGVATYAQVLARCLADAGAVATILDGDTYSAGRSRAGRWIAALRDGPRRAEPSGDAGTGLHAFDVFREAQVFFNLHGKLLPITCDRPPAVMHWTYPVPLFVEGARNLYTVHDLIPLTHPELTPIAADRHRRILARIAEQAHRIVAVSDAVAREITELLAIAPERIVTTWQAVDSPLQSDPPLPAPLRAGRYFLFCGTVEPRKNLARMVEAHARSGTDLPLVVAGPRGVGQVRLEALLAATPGVIRLPWLPRPQLLGLMRRARALLYPSLAEGFGLPIAEAMTLGCPVLTSCHGATAEIAGDAALLVEPHNVAAMSEAIGQLAGDDRLVARLRAAGFARAARYAIAPYARRLRALYAEALMEIAA